MYTVGIQLSRKPITKSLSTYQDKYYNFTVSTVAKELGLATVHADTNEW